jgi:hypothetical protein
MAGPRNPNIENNELASACSRLYKAEKQHHKMKVYPGMFMKTKGVKNRPPE